MSRILKLFAWGRAPLLALTLALATQAAAQEVYPSKPVRMIVTISAGGQADGIARMLAQAVGQRLGQTVVVENRTGAAGQIGIDTALRSRPDGYTLLFTPTDLVLLPATKVSATFDPIKDVAPVALVSRAPMVIAVTNKMPVKSLDELVKYAKARPGEVRFGSYGTGSLLHLIGDLFRLKAGIDIVHVPYKGASDATMAVIGGQIEMGIMAPSTFNANSAHLRALAQTGPARSPAVPDLPTMSELGMPEVTVENWFAVVAPAGTPAAIVTRLNTEINAVLRQPEFKERARKFGVETYPISPVEFAQYIADEQKRWIGVVQAAGIAKQ